MSTLGSVIGAGVGAVAGFFIGGPTGALYVASLGYGLGLAIDPLKPDAPAPGSPEQIFSNSVGRPVADLLGTSAIMGQLLLYGLERTEVIESDAGGKGGGAPTSTSNEVYLSWAQGICLGDSSITLFAVYKDNNVLLWSGELKCPETGGVETIVLEGMGTMRFYFGTDDQETDPVVSEIIGDATIAPPWRKLCYAVFDNCLVGGFSRMPTIKFIIKKAPVLDFTEESNTIGPYDYNPAHAQYYIMNKMTGLSENWLNTADFDTFASSLNGEALGISILLDNYQEALSYIVQINTHISSILRYGNDGKFHPLLIREPADLSSLPIIDEDSLIGMPSITRKSWIDTINELTIQYNKIFGDTDLTLIQDGFNGVDTITSIEAWGDKIGIPWVDSTSMVIREGDAPEKKLYPSENASFSNPLVYVDTNYTGACEANVYYSPEEVTSCVNAESIFGVSVFHDPETNEGYLLSKINFDVDDLQMKLEGDETIFFDGYQGSGNYKIRVQDGICTAYFNDEQIGTEVPCTNRTSGKAGIKIAKITALLPPLILEYTTLQMSVDESQILYASGGVGPYTWDFTGGGGTLEVAEDTSSVVYTAPSTNAGCSFNPTIILRDSCNQEELITIAVNAVFSDPMGQMSAVWYDYTETDFPDGNCPPPDTNPDACKCPLPLYAICNCYITTVRLNCMNEISYGPCTSVGQASFCCSQHVECLNVPTSTCFGGGRTINELLALGVEDFRSQADIDRGCCMESLL